MNKLKPNVHKTKCMYWSSKHKVGIIGYYDINIVIDSSRTEVANVFKYLLVLNDNTLNFDHDVQMMCKNIGKKIVFVSRVTRNLSLPSKRMVFGDFVLSHFQYCSSFPLAKITSLGYKNDRTNHDKANIMISKIIMLNQLGWLPVKFIIMKSVFIFVF